MGVESYFVRLESIDNLSGAVTVGNVGLSVLTPAAVVRTSRTAYNKQICSDEFEK